MSTRHNFTTNKRDFSSVPVSPPANFSCQPAHEACLFCEWKEIPRDSLHGELLQYQINYRVYSRSHANMTTEWSNITIPCTQRTYMVENLAAYTRYELELVGSTAAGSSPPAWTQAKTNEGGWLSFLKSLTFILFATSRLPFCSNAIFKKAIPVFGNSEGVYFSSITFILCYGCNI